jgi:sorbitol-specific phosphotransferase system component IIC
LAADVFMHCQSAFFPHLLVGLRFAWQRLLSNWGWLSCSLSGVGVGFGSLGLVGWLTEYIPGVWGNQHTSAQGGAFRGVPVLQHKRQKGSFAGACSVGDDVLCLACGGLAALLICLMVVECTAVAGDLRQHA